MRSKIILIIVAGFFGITACDNEELLIQPETTINIEGTTTVLLDGVSYKANVIVDPVTGEELELVAGKDTDKIKAFFEENTNYSTHVNLDTDVVQYFSNEEKMDQFMNIPKTESSTTNTSSTYNGLIRLYEQSSFGGRVYSRNITSSVEVVESDLNNVIVGGSSFNDIISSFQIFSGSPTAEIKIRFYEHANLNGRSIAYSGQSADILNLQSQCRKKTLWVCSSSWNDSITSYSVRVTPVSGGGSGGGGGPIVVN